MFDVLSEDDKKQYENRAKEMHEMAVKEWESRSTATPSNAFISKLWG
jgi:hypothetical protein